MSNITAFLDTIAQSEGTNAKDGYTYLFGSSINNDLRFTDFSKHPDIKRPFGKNNFSTAAGRYQILYSTWVDLCKKLKVADFKPGTQDLMAIELLRECGAYNYIISGDLLSAVNKAAHIWASLPNNNYGQPEHSYVTIKSWYLANGGDVKSA